MGYLPLSAWLGSLALLYFLMALRSSKKPSPMYIHFLHMTSTSPFAMKVRTYSRPINSTVPPAKTSLTMKRPNFLDFHLPSNPFRRDLYNISFCPNGNSFLIIFFFWAFRFFFHHAYLVTLRIFLLVFHCFKHVEDNLFFIKSQYKFS